MFVVFCVKNVQKSLKSGQFQEMKRDLHLLCILSLQRAKIMCKKMAVSMQSKVNQFKLNQKCFDQFLHTLTYEKLKKSFGEDESNIQSYIKAIMERAKLQDDEVELGEEIE